MHLRLMYVILLCSDWLISFKDLLLLGNSKLLQADIFTFLWHHKIKEIKIRIIIMGVIYTARFQSGLQRNTFTKKEKIQVFQYGLFKKPLLPVTVHYQRRCDSCPLLSNRDIKRVDHGWGCRVTALSPLTLISGYYCDLLTCLGP